MGRSTSRARIAARTLPRRTRGPPPPQEKGGPQGGGHGPRQPEILELIASGLSTSDIAIKHTPSTETVRNHLRGVFRELHVHTRLEAIAAAQRLGLLAAPALGPQPSDADVHTG